MLAELKRLRERHGFTLLKYSTYALLLINVFLFLREESRSLAHTFSSDIRLADVIQVFAATIDTAAWLVLLLLFELETWVLPDAAITKTVGRMLHGARAVCFLLIVYAFYGYLEELAAMHDVSALPGDACALAAGGDWSWLLRLDKYAPLTPENCAAAQWRLGEFNIAAGSEALQLAQWLAWTDVINAAAWIAVVAVLEIDVRLQLRRALSDRLPALSKWAKAALYSILLGAAVFWGFKGDFLDFWDASLWIFAFAFIEMNIFGWQAATRNEGRGFEGKTS